MSKEIFVSSLDTSGPNLIKDSIVIEESPSIFLKRMDPSFIRESQILLYYDDFGLPGTHLAARAGYVLFDIHVNQILSYRWMRIS